MPCEAQVVKNRIINESPRPNSRHTLRSPDRSLAMLRIIDPITNSNAPRATAIATTIIHAPSLMWVSSELSSAPRTGTAPRAGYVDWYPQASRAIGSVGTTRGAVTAESCVAEPGSTHVVYLRVGRGER